MSQQKDPYAEKLLNAALLYASFGWEVAPCYEPIKHDGQYVCSCGAPDRADPKKHSIGKHPRTEHGLRDASTDPDVIRKWWRRWPRANIAVVGGRASNLVIIDFDFPKGAEEELRRLETKYGPFPESATVKTGNGLHVYLQHPGGRRIPSGTSILGSGVDIRADGGYAIAPPSFHYRGREYMWLTAPKVPADIQPMPDWMIEFFDNREVERQKSIEERRTHHVAASSKGRSKALTLEDKKRRCQAYIDTKPGIAEGGRNEMAAKEVCPVGLDFDLDEDEFWPILESWNDRNSPPLSERELRRTLFSANRSRQSPRGCKLDEDSDEWVAQQEKRRQRRKDEEEAAWAATMATAEAEIGHGRATKVHQPRDRRPAESNGQNGGRGGGGRGGAGGGGGGRGGGGDGPTGDEPEKRREQPDDIPHDNRLRRSALMDLAVSSSLLGPDQLPRTEIGNSQRILRDHGADIRHVHHTNRWYLWTGTKWTEDSRGEIIGELVAKTMRSMHQLMPTAMQQGEEEAKAWRSWIKTSETKRCMESSLSLAGSYRAVALMPEDFDQHDFLVNTRSGIVDIRDMSSRTPDRRLLMSKVAYSGYTSKTDCPVWKKFLHRIFDGDEELITFFKRAAGYSLTGSTREQCLFFCFGHGKNGKSTAITALQECANEYARATDFDTFLEKQGEKASNDLARLQGARLVAATEPDRRKRLDEATIKRVTGQDMITARFLYSEYFEFKFRAKIWLAANHKPQITGTDEGIWRRIRLIPFTQQISEAEKDPDLPEKLRKEYPAILAWMIEGANEWYHHGLTMPEAVKQATASYRTEMDKLAAFLNEKCVLKLDLKGQSSKVYEAYKNWCSENGERYLSHRKFTQALSERGIQSRKGKKFNYYQGLALRAEDDPPADKTYGYDDDDDDDDFRGPIQGSLVDPD